MVHQTAQELHRHVFESERRAVKQFEHKEIVAELDKRAYGLVAECTIGFANHRTKGGLIDIVGKMADNGFGDFGIRGHGRAFLI